MMQFKEKASILRKQRGMSQLELAEALDVSRQAISKWEQGTAMPSTENLIKMGVLFGVSIETLTNDDLSIESPPDVRKAQPEEKKEDKEDTVERNQDTDRKLKWIIAALCFALCIAAIGIIVLIGIVKDQEEKISEADGNKEDIIPIKDLEKEVIILDEYDVFIEP